MNFGAIVVLIVLLIMVIAAIGNAFSKNVDTMAKDYDDEWHEYGDSQHGMITEFDEDDVTDNH